MSLLRHTTDRGSPRFGDEARLLRCGFAAVCFLLLTSFCAIGAEPKRVLMIHSFGTVAPPFTTHSTAFQAELVKQMGDRVDLDEVSLDMARYAAPEMQEAVVDYLERRGTKWKPDLVVSIGSPAGIFLAKFRHRLFPNIPILYCSLDRRLLGREAFDENTAFVGSNYEVKGFAEDILQIAPDTKNIAIVIGATPLEQYWTEAFREGFEPFTDRVNFIWLNDLSFDQMLERVQKLPPHSFIFLILFLRDAAGVTQNADEALQRLHAVANAPINSIFTSQMGLGIVGGRLYPSTEDGIKAAETAVQILNGASPWSFPPKIVPPTAPQYDWRELRRWKIDQRRLPTGSTVLFQTPTIWQQYRWWIIAAMSVGVVQALLITGLVANLIRRRRAEGSLVESEERFRVAADVAPVMIWMSGPDKLCTFFNKGWLDFTGRTMEQELGNGWSEGVHAQDLEKCVLTYVSAFDTRKPFTMQYRLRNRDGDYRWLSDNGVPRYDGHGNFTGYIGACVDLTELLKREEVLRQFEERVTLAADAARFGVWEMDTTTRAIWMSDSARTLFQFEPEMPITYEAFQDRVHTDDRAFREAAVNQAIQTEGGYELEYRATLPDGTVRWIAGRARCAKDASGEFTRLIGVSADMTERKLAEERARHHREEISRLSRGALLGEMTASIAHELNQPLTAIINNASAGQCFIDQGDIKLDTLREILVDIAADGHRAHDVIANIRNTIKKGATLQESVDLNFIVTRVAHAFQPDMAAHSCELETSLAKDFPTIEANPVQIHQVLINLVSNALDAMRDTPPARRKIQIATKRNGDGSIEVSVRDCGAGIPDEVRDRLFDQFFTTKAKGLGMGLAIVRSIVEAHGGTIDVENLAGGGARFYFILPISQEITK
jgi:PAS domain S-box-containing protein